MSTNTSKSSRKYDPLKPRVVPEARNRIDVHEAITAKIVAAIEAGAGEFQMPWHRSGIAFTLPKNAITGKDYRGSNILSLWIDADEKKFAHQVWATYKQWHAHGAQVRGGEKGSLIVKYGEWVPNDAGADANGHPKRQSNDQRAAGHEHSDDDTGDPKRMYAKAAHVFNIDQVDAPAELRAELLPPAAPRRDLTERLAAVDAFVAAVGIAVREGGQRAFYRHPGSNGEGDFIQMPPRDLFTGTPTSTPTEAYYATLLHEEIHGSGAVHRLDRQHGRFGDKAYAFEELVAELGAAFLCAQLEVTNTPRPDHAQYCASWLTVLKGDAKAIFTAASLATRAVDYLLGLQPKPAPDLDPGLDHDAGPNEVGEPNAHRTAAADRPEGPA
jgi:antirestriction protein ArdC